MGYTFGPFDITGSVVNLTGAFNTSGSIILTGSISSTGTKSTLVFDEMSISHVSGTRDYYGGVGIAYDALPQGFGSGNDGPNITLIPTASGAWMTLNKNARVTGYRWYTNVVGADFPDWNNVDNETKIFMFLGLAYLAPSSTTTQGITNTLLSSEPGQYYWPGTNWQTGSAGAVLNSPVQVGNAGTLYITGSSNVSLAPTAYSPKYFTFMMSIGSQFPTKTYKFKFELDIEDLGW
jgi:hypothetical protein